MEENKQIKEIIKLNEGVIKEQSLFITNLTNKMDEISF